jgi:hypothetical protein
VTARYYTTTAGFGWAVCDRERAYFTPTGHRLGAPVAHFHERDCGGWNEAYAAAVAECERLNQEAEDGNVHYGGTGNL